MSKTKIKPRFKLVEFRRGCFLWLHGVTKLPVGYVDAEHAQTASQVIASGRTRPYTRGVFRVQSTEGYFVVRAVP